MACRNCAKLIKKYLFVLQMTDLSVDFVDSCALNIFLIFETKYNKFFLIKKIYINKIYLS